MNIFELFPELEITETPQRTLGGFRVKPLNIGDAEVDEAVKLDAPSKTWSRAQMQDYLTRIKTNTKTKADRYKPIIHGSNVKALVQDDGTTQWDLDDLRNKIMVRPKTLLGSNAKMQKSAAGDEIIYDLTLPALSGIVIDEETGEFVEINTCPGAGECQLYCYVRKGGYVMFPATSLSAARSLNFLVNNPNGFMTMLDSEVKALKAKASKYNVTVVVRYHDAGDFFSKDYAMAWSFVIRLNPDIQFWVYTRVATAALFLHAQKRGNLALYFSADRDNIEVARMLESKGINIAYVDKTFAAGKEAFPNATRCPENNKALPLISTKGSACVTCGLCVHGRKDVLFSATKK